MAECSRMITNTPFNPLIEIEFETKYLKYMVGILSPSQTANFVSSGLNVILFTVSGPLKLKIVVIVTKS